MKYPFHIPYAPTKEVHGSIANVVRYMKYPFHIPYATISMTKESRFIRTPVLSPAQKAENKRLRKKIREENNLGAGTKIDPKKPTK